VDFSPVQIGIVLLIVLLVFGAKRLPEIGRSLGSSAREFKHGITGGDDEPKPPSTPSGTAARHDENT
jgi:sec-independent protein translocase protein TatA